MRLVQRFRFACNRAINSILSAALNDDNERVVELLTNLIEFGKKRVKKSLEDGNACRKRAYRPIERKDHRKQTSNRSNGGRRRDCGRRRVGGGRVLGGRIGRDDDGDGNGRQIAALHFGMSVLIAG